MALKEIFPKIVLSKVIKNGVKKFHGAHRHSQFVQFNNQTKNVRSRLVKVYSMHFIVLKELNVFKELGRPDT